MTYLDFLSNAFHEGLTVCAVSVCGNDNVVSDFEDFWGVAGVDAVGTICETGVPCNDSKVFSRDGWAVRSAEQDGYLALNLHSGRMGQSDAL